MDTVLVSLNISIASRICCRALAVMVPFCYFLQRITGLWCANVLVDVLTNVLVDILVKCRHADVMGRYPEDELVDMSVLRFVCLCWFVL